MAIANPHAARRAGPCRIAALWLLPLAAIGAATSAAPDATPESVLEAAFANRYEVDTIYEMELVIRDRSGREQRRSIHSVSKRIGGRSHSVGRVVEPANLRGLTVLIIEAASGGRDSFVYLPALRRARRISGAQRVDSFLGSDLTYEDFERQRVADFALAFQPEEQVAGERCLMIRALPSDDRGYAAVVFAVAESDRAILEYRYFAAGAEVPYRVIETPRAAMRRENGHLLPTRFSVRHTRGTSTELVIRALAVDPAIDDRVFSLRALEQQQPLPAAPAR
jgi:hypothetical protein